jgi:hypothetical protein
MTQSGNLNDLNASTGALSYLELAPGARVKRTDGAILEVMANPRDGAWLLVRIVENPNDPSSVGTEDMVFFIDVEGMA